MVPEDTARPKKLHLMLANGGRAIIDGKAQERFWSKVAVTGGCWWWMGAQHEQGYGHFGLSGYIVRAHRVSYLIANGKCDPKLMVCHHCDTPRCVRPDHLFQGTRQDNSFDMIEKGRAPSKASEERKQRMRDWWTKQPPGTRIHKKLSMQQAEEIRERYARGGISQRVLGAEYGVSHGAVAAIVKGRAWKA